MGTAPNEITLARALELIDSAGPGGITLEAFAARWYRRRGGPKGQLTGVSSFLSTLRDLGYVVRQGQRTHVRVALSAAGRATLERSRAEFVALQNEPPEPGMEPW